MDKSSLSFLQYKLSAIVLSVTVVAIGLFGALLLRHVERTEYQEASSNLLEVSHRIRGMLSVNHGLMIVAAKRHFAVFEAMFHEPFHLDTGTTLHLAGHDVAQLTVGRRPVRPDFPAIDEFTSGSLGYVASIFVRHDDDFLRVATSLRDGSGQRAVGTLLGRDHPAYHLLLGGQSYIGPARLFERPYMTKYRPLLDPGGRVIGALFVGLDLSANFAQIREEIKAIRVGRTGYVYVADSQPGGSYGRLLIHPTHEGGNLLQLAEPGAQDFVRQALAGGDGMVGRYQFRDPSGQLREKIAAVAQFPAWHWVIGAGAYYEEFTEQRLHLQYAVFGTLLVAALAIMVALMVSIRRLVLVPLLALHETLRASEQRFRTVVTSSSDIIYTTDEKGYLTAVFDKGLVVPPNAIAALIGQPAEAFLGHADPQHQAFHARAIGGEKLVYDWSAEGPAGHFDFQSSLSPMCDAQGRVSGLVCIGRDITERRRAEALANHVAHHDVLTGLPNRALMQDRLQQAIRQAERSGRAVGLLFIDLDHFKAVNDQFGHEIGDQLLQAIARRMLACVRDSDTVARIGGDEFVVVISDASGQAALVQVAEKLLDAFTRPFALAACTLAMSPSIGISSYPADATDAMTLLKVADAAMYEAKNAGRAGLSSTAKTV